MKFRILLTLSLSLLGPSIAKADEVEEGSGSQSSGFTLHGGVEHSEKLPPVEKEFRRGAKIDIDKPFVNNPNNHWYELPDWAVGNWTSTQSTKVYARDLRSGRELSAPETRHTKMDFSWGFQADNRGHVWEFAKEPYTLIVDSSDHKVVKRILQREFLRADDAKVIVKIRTDNVIVNKADDKVIRSIQSENIQTCVPSPRECMTCTASYKLFDEQGKALEVGREVNISKKLSPFKSIDEYEGRNMTLLFREFMTSHGKGELLR